MLRIGRLTMESKAEPLKLYAHCGLAPQRGRVRRGPPKALQRPASVVARSRPGRVPADAGRLVGG